MSLPLLPPLEPMLARAQTSLPAGMAYEPKWDGFRCLVFRDGDSVQLISRNGRELTRYFPEVVAAVIAETPAHCVLDGELVIVHNDRLDFDQLSERIHPAQTRISLLSSITPASLICWDLLCLGDENLLDEPFMARRGRLVHALTRSGNHVHLTPQTREIEVARQWFSTFEGAGLDGIVAKPVDGAYLPGKRAMVKVKHSREADVVVAGYRLHRHSTPTRPLLGSLQLGLYDHGELAFVGVAAAFSELVRAELAIKFDSLRVAVGAEHPWAGNGGGGRRPGTASRWNTELKETLLISPQLVCEVSYEHLQGTRFRHSAGFRRWRPDRDPDSCTFDQLEEIPGFDLADVLAARI
jgi:ATP-dependent DNA ligase